MAGPSVQDGSNPPLLPRDISNANLSISHTTGGIAVPLDPAAEVEDLPMLEIPSDSTPRSVPISNNYSFRPQSYLPPSFSGDSSSYDFNYAIESGQQNYLIDPSQSLNTLLSVNSSSSTEPWTSLDATGVSTKPVLDPRRQRSSFRRIHTQPKDTDDHSDTFKDSGLGTLKEPSQYDTRSQLSAPITDMNQSAPYYFETPLPSQPQELEISAAGAAGLGDDAVQESSPTQTRSRRGTKKDEKVTCTMCHITVKTPSDLKKHTARHYRGFKCEVEGCSKQIAGFATINDLQRHEKSVHGKETRKTKSYKCFAVGCSKCEKIWPRLDNFKQHLQRMHPAEGLEDLLRMSNHWYELTTPSDPAQSERVVEALHEQERRVKADKRKARKQGLRQDRQDMQDRQETEDHAQQQRLSRQQQPLPSLQTLQPHTPQQNLDFLSPIIPSSARPRGAIRTHPPRNQDLSRSRQSPYGTPTVSQANQSFMPVQPLNMTRLSSEIPPHNHRLHTTAGQSNATPSFGDDMPSTTWEIPEQATTPPELQESRSAFGQNELDADSFMFGDLEQPERPHTLADPNAIRDYQVRFMHETEPMPPRHNPEFDLIGNSIFLTQIGAANDSILQSSPASGNQPQTPTIQVNCPSDDAFKDYQDVIVEELRSFLDKHDGKHNDKVVTREEIQQHVRRALLSSLASRSTAGTLSEVGSLVCPKVGKTHFQCKTCGVFKLRQCDLNKHEKRHSRPYGCVLDNCDRSFGSKGDWKRHEQTHPVQKECYRCDGTHYVPGSRTGCQKVFYNGKDAYRQHLRECSIIDALHENILSRCHVRGNHQLCFWCGFCNSIQFHNFTGTEALNYRLGHIYEHFHQQDKKRVADWIELGGEGKTKSEVQKEQNAAKLEQLHSQQRSLSTDEDTGSSHASSSSSSASLPKQVQPPQATPRNATQIERRSQRELSNPSAGHQQINQQNIWSHPQKQQQQQQQTRMNQQRARNQHRGSQPSRRRPPQRTAFQDPVSAPHVNAEGQVIATTLTCCRCENQWSYSFGGKCCTMCGHWCGGCGREYR